MASPHSSPGLIDMLFTIWVFTSQSLFHCCFCCCWEPPLLLNLLITQTLYTRVAQGKAFQIQQVRIHKLLQFGALVSQSSKTKFYKTTSGGGQSTITGLFQCRGDLSTADCFNCVSKIPTLMKKLCGKVVAARVQLHGCYILYEVAGFIQISGLEVLYKTCSTTHVDGEWFEEKRDMAFQVVSNGVVTNHGFFTTRYEALFVLGQCEGDVGDTDCGECVKTAIQKAKDECGSSISGQVYLHKCFISYNYFPNGIPKGLPSSSGSGQNIGRTAAIVLGGVVAVGFVVVCLVFTRNLLKKKDDY